MKAGQKQTGKTDTVLWVLVLILVVLGLGALFSASEYNGAVALANIFAGRQPRFMPKWHRN